MANFRGLGRGPVTDSPLVRWTFLLIGGPARGVHFKRKHNLKNRKIRHKLRARTGCWAKAPDKTSRLYASAVLQSHRSQDGPKMGAPGRPRGLIRRLRGATKTPDTGWCVGRFSFR